MKKTLIQTWIILPQNTDVIIASVFIHTTLRLVKKFWGNLVMHPVI